MKPKTPCLAVKLSAMPSTKYSGVLLLVAIALLAGNGEAAPVGKVVQLSDPSQLLAKKINGTIKVLKSESPVDKGDLLESQANTYARIKFIDGSEITLGPHTQFRIDNYHYNEDEPRQDHSIFTLIKGTLRSITGSLGKRSRDRYQLNTPAASIGIRGSSYLVRYSPPDTWTSDAPNTHRASCSDNGLGVTLAVADGVIRLTNEGGTKSYSAGQYGCALTYQQTPEILLTDPELQFNPSFDKSGSVRCDVR